MPDDSDQLLLATRRGDQTAARSLWQRHAPRLVAYARAIIGSRGKHQDAEDIVQAVFCRVMGLAVREVAAVRDTGAWLAQITRRTALNWLRARRMDAARRDALHRSGERLHQEERGHQDHALSNAIATLPVRLREVVVLKHVAGLTFDQIELATGINRNTAAARHRAALALLRTALQPAPAGSPPPAHTTPAGAPQARQGMVQHA